MNFCDNIWLKSYDPDVKSEIRIPDISFIDYMMAVWDKYPDRRAYDYFGASMTFRELKEESRLFANVLIENGLKKGDTVAVCLPNTPQYLIAIAGGLMAGCSVSGLPPLFMPDEMEYQLNDCKAGALVILDQMFDQKFTKIADKVPKLKLIMLAGARDYMSTDAPFPEIKPIEGKVVGSFRKMVKQAGSKPLDALIGPDDTCFIQYTGGTTGVSKGVVLTHRNVVANTLQIMEWAKIKPGEGNWLSAFPLFHIAGLAFSCTPMANAVPQVLIPDPRNMDHLIQSMDKFRPEYMTLVPSLIIMLLANERFREVDFSGLKFCISGGAPFPVDRMEELEGTIGKGKLVEGLGMTEASPFLCINPIRGEKRAGSVGLPLSNTYVRIVNELDGKTDVPIGSDGELLVSGPQVMKAYLNNPEASVDTLCEHDGKIWLRTGDVARMDENGYVYLVDRLKDMLIVGGYKVFSSEVENKLYKHPAIEICALIGLPNPERPDSQIVKLVYQKGAAYDQKPDDELNEEIRALARETLAPYKVPKIFQVVDAMPLTSVGKVDKKRIRELFGKS